MQKQRQTTAARIRRLKGQYRRKIAIAVIISLLIGLVGGFFAGRYMAGRGADRTPAEPVTGPNVTVASNTPAPKDAATPEPGTTETKAPGAEVTEAPSAAQTTQTAQNTETVVPFGSTQTVEIELNSDGTLHRTDDGTAFEKAVFDITVLRSLTNDYYMDTYGTTHSLKGTETGVEMKVLLKDYMGAVKIDPNRLNFALESADGVRETGYKLTDAEIQGKSEFELLTNVETVLYKRFDYSARVGDMKYLVVTAVTSAGEKVYKFELGTPVRPTPTPAPTVYYETLSKGSKGDNVVRLQQALIEKGYLAEGSADGAYGNMTVDAVKAAQKDMGLAEDGIATTDFQKKLYGEA